MATLRKSRSKKAAGKFDVARASRSISSQFSNLDSRQPGQWPILPRLACGIALMALVLLAGWYFYWSDQQDELAKVQQQEETLKQEYRTKIAQAVNLEALQKQRNLVKEYVATLEKQLPNKAEMDALLSDINQAGLGRGLQFQLFRPGQVVVNDYYAELPINIKITGNYHDVGAFASDIANLPRIVTLNNMSLVAGKEGEPLTLDAVAKTFRYLDAEEIADQKRIAAEKKVNAAKGAK
jgi:type IV pilus assembly protein PilO